MVPSTNRAPKPANQWQLRKMYILKIRLRVLACMFPVSDVHVLAHYAEIAMLLKYGDSRDWIEDEKKTADLDARDAI